MQESRTLPTGLMMVRMKKANGEVIGKEGDDGMGVKTMIHLNLDGCGVFLAWQGIEGSVAPTHLLLEVGRGTCLGIELISGKGPIKGST